MGGGGHPGTLCPATLYAGAAAGPADGVPPLASSSRAWCCDRRERSGSAVAPRPPHLWEARIDGKKRG